MFDTLLASPYVYEFSQFLWYKKGKQEEYIKSYAQPSPGFRVLDIGCGVGSILNYFRDVTYHGVDINPAYIKYARKRYGNRGLFQLGRVGQEVEVEPESYDLVMANGVLHHLEDQGSLDLLKFAYSSLKSGGRLVTRDGCFEESINSLAKFLLKADRGKHVRTQIEYQLLIDQVFPKSQFEVRRDMLRLPYSLIIYQCFK